MFRRYNVHKDVTRKNYQIFATLTATIVVISDGMQFGWSSPIIPFLNSKKSHIKLSPKDEAWLEATYLIGSSLPLTAILANKFGRQKLIFLSSTLSIIVWILVAISTNVIHLYATRVLSGVTGNLIFVAVPMYVSEIADQHIRGFLTGIVYIMFWIGLILIYATGPFVPFYVPSLIIITLLVIQIVVFSFMPESPYFLIIQEKEEAARKALRKLRQTENVENEYSTIANSIKTQKEDRSGFKKMFLKKGTIKAFLIVTILSTFQAFSSLAVMQMNVHSILEEAKSIYIESGYSSIIFAVITLISVTICLFFIDKFGRRILLIFSSFFSGLCLLCLAVYFNLKNCNFDTSVYSWVPVVGIFTFAVIFNIGLGVIPRIIATELFSDKIKAIGLCYMDFTLTIMDLLSVLFYKTTSIRYGMHVPIYGFAATACLAAVFTFFVIPETKTKTLQEIQAMLEMS